MKKCVFGIGTILYSITRIDTSVDFIIEDDLYYDIIDIYKKVYSIFHNIIRN